MPLSTGGKAGRRKRRKRLTHAGKSLEDYIDRECEQNDPPERTASSNLIKKRRLRLSELYAILTALIIAPAYVVFWIWSNSGENMGRGAPFFFIFVINFPLCVAWVLLDRKDDPGADEPLSPKLREAARKGAKASMTEKLGSPRWWQY